MSRVTAAQVIYMYMSLLQLNTSPQIEYVCVYSNTLSILLFPITMLSTIAKIIDFSEITRKKIVPYILGYLRMNL